MKKADLKVGMILKSQFHMDKNMPYYLILTVGPTGFSALKSHKPDHFWVSVMADMAVLNHGHHCWWDARYLKPLTDNTPPEDNEDEVKCGAV